jgi:predicted nucleotidyltransferase
MLTLDPEERTWLDRYRETLKREHADTVLRLVVYGSKARGDAHNESDVDLLLILHDTASDMKKALRRIGHDLAAATPVAPSIMAYTEREWNTLKELRSPYSAAVERDGVTVL